MLLVADSADLDAFSDNGVSYDVGRLNDDAAANGEQRADHSHTRTGDRHLFRLQRDAAAPQSQEQSARE